MAEYDIEPTFLSATDGGHLLDVTFIDDKDLAMPWKRKSTSIERLAGPMPRLLSVTLTIQTSPFLLCEEATTQRQAWHRSDRSSGPQA